MAEFVTVGRSDEGENEARSFQVGGQMVGVARVSGALLAFTTSVRTYSAA